MADTTATAAMVSPMVCASEISILYLLKFSPIIVGFEFKPDVDDDTGQYYHDAEQNGDENLHRPGEGLESFNHL